MFVGNVARQVDATEFGDQVVAETLLIRRQVVELGKLRRKDRNETASCEEEARSTVGRNECPVFGQGPNLVPIYPAVVDTPLTSPSFHLSLHHSKTPTTGS